MFDASRIQIGNKDFFTYIPSLAIKVSVSSRSQPPSSQSRANVLTQFEAVRVAELYLGQWCAAARVMLFEM